MGVPTSLILLSLLATLTTLATLAYSSEHVAKNSRDSPILNRMRREGWSRDSWKVVGPSAAVRDCYARPCWFAEDCCQGYECSGFTAVERRSSRNRVCTPISYYK